MKTPLRILHLEDEPNDTALMSHALEADGIKCEILRVVTRGEFIQALEKEATDLVIADFTLPDFDGISAAEMVRARWPDLPLIIVTATLREEQAIESLKSGARDYVLKNGLVRLAPAVRRVMQDVRQREERRRLEEQFVESQKMEVIGQLASGIAHDFNNILAVIMGCSDWIASELVPQSPLKKYTDEIQHAAQRAAGLTQQLLVFSRRETVKPVVLDLNEVVQEFDKMLRRLIDENIELRVDLNPSAGRIRADSGYVGQVMMNLVVNARDAMPTGGKLVISTENITLAANHPLSPPGLAVGDYVLLKVKDSGVGMTEETKAHLFEAFFTTKPSGKGTGLGLATCQTIIQQCGGYIRVSSELGKGATFTVYFPRVDQPVQVKTNTAPSGPLQGGTEVLLVVEDEPSVRSLARDVLRAQGYEVLTASNGQDALHVARLHKGAPISLVVTDVIMPVMGGKVMAEWLKTTHPDLRVLFTSGYTDDSLTLHGVLQAGTAFLAKPYSPRTLAYKVREMLDQKMTAPASPEISR